MEAEHPNQDLILHMTPSIEIVRQHVVNRGYSSVQEWASLMPLKST